MFTLGSKLSFWYFCGCGVWDEYFACRFNFSLTAKLRKFVKGTWLWTVEIQTLFNLAIALPSLSYTIWDETLGKSACVVLTVCQHVTNTSLVSRCACFWKKCSLCLLQSCSVLPQLLSIGVTLFSCFHIFKNLSLKSSEDIAFHFLSSLCFFPSDDNVQVCKSKDSLIVKR